MLESTGEPVMRLFLDSADPADWERWLPTGIFHGVTTNPLLLERAGQKCTLDNLAVLTARAGDLGARVVLHAVNGGRDGSDFWFGDRRAWRRGGIGQRCLGGIGGLLLGLRQLLQPVVGPQDEPAGGDQQAAQQL